MVGTISPEATLSPYNEAAERPISPRDPKGQILKVSLVLLTLLSRIFVKAIPTM